MFYFIVAEYSASWGGFKPQFSKRNIWDTEIKRSIAVSFNRNGVIPLILLHLLLVSPYSLSSNQRTLLSDSML